MQDYVIEVRSTLIHIFIWGVVLSLSALFSGFGQYIPSLLLGVVASSIYFLSICFRVKKSATLPMGKAVSYMRTGWLIRLVFIVLMLIISLKIPGVYFWAAVIGLFSVQMVIIIKAFYLVLNSLRKG